MKTNMESKVIEEYRGFKTLRPIFITGMGRSGTTLMLRLLDGHTQLLVHPFENSIIQDYFHAPNSNPIKRGVDEAILSRNAQKIISYMSELPEYQVTLTPKVDIRIKPLKSFPDLGSVDVVFDNIDVDYFSHCFSDVLSSVQGEWKIEEIFVAWTFSHLKASGIRNTLQYGKWVAKFVGPGSLHPAYVLAFPNCSFIHMIRDPRASYVSQRIVTEQRHPEWLNSNISFFKPRMNCLLDHLSFYKFSFDKVRETSQLKRDNFLVIHYEDLVANTKNIMLKVSEFLDISYEDTLIQPKFKNRPWRSNSSFKIEQDNDLKVFNKSAERWQKIICWYERIAIESYLGNELLEHGYTNKIRFRTLKKCAWWLLKVWDQSLSLITSLKF